MRLQKTFSFLFGILFAAVCSVYSAESLKIGEEMNGHFISPKIKEGSDFIWVLYVPTCYDPTKPAALYMAHDGLNMTHAKVLEQMAEKGEVPVTICVGLASGELAPPSGEGFPRRMRAEEYDEVDSEYANMLVDEFMPWLIERFQLNIDPNPDMHLVTGASSGGISAWDIAWYRNDYFRRCFISSPTFSSICGGELPMYLVRVTEPRPIRVYEIYGRHEPNIYAGDSYIAALMGENTFEYAGYAYKSEYFPDGGHGAGYNDPPVIERAMQFLWENWQTEPVKVLRQQERLDRLVEFGTTWEETNDTFPEPIPAVTKYGTYDFDGGVITLTDSDGNVRTVSDEFFGEITGLAVSTDGWRLYVADKSRRFIFAVTIMTDGSLGKAYKLAPLRLPHDVVTLGASGLCVDTKDRVYAATPLGIQSMVSFGVLDAILPLPGDREADAVAFGGEDGKTLYVRSGNLVFKRPMKTTGKPADFPVTAPGTNGYFDGD